MIERMLTPEYDPNKTQELPPAIDETGFKPLAKKTPEKFDTPESVLITTGMGVEFLDPVTKEKKEGRVISIPPVEKGSPEIVHIDSVEGIVEVSLADLREHMFDVLTDYRDKKKYASDVMN